MAKRTGAKRRTVAKKAGGKSRSALTGRYVAPSTKTVRGNSDKTIEVRSPAAGTRSGRGAGKGDSGFEILARVDENTIELVRGSRKSEPIDLSAELRQYREALIAQIDNIVVPGVIARIVKGAASVAPVDLARRMLSVAPAPAPANKMAEQVGPEFYDTNGVSVVLAEPGADPLSKQAVEQRRKRRTILALQTSEGRWIYPTWQFRNHEVIPGLAEVLGAFDRDDRPFSTWSIGTWLTTPLEDLDGGTAVEWLDADADPDHLVTVARHTAARWAA